MDSVEIRISRHEDLGRAVSPSPIPPPPERVRDRNDIME